ncbi:hypothetical protein [uncultured Microbacterium sp.]|uniref:hypothetical protein n=1 Tax=uncultured Microbacterium sp. TaxID=191216 RepID=UPI0025CD4322|nr:hypothetical protein [uncultured Microbacterium sp.]
MDPVDLQRADLEDGFGEELIDRRSMESAVIFGGGGEQVRSLSKQRWLQLRGVGVSRGDDGR